MRFAAVAAGAGVVSLLMAVVGGLAGAPLWLTVLGTILTFVFGVVAVQVGASTWRARRLVTEHPWIARTGTFGVEVRTVSTGKSSSRKQRTEVLLLHADGRRPEALCRLTPVHWEGGPPPAGPLDVWVAGEPPDPAVITRPGGRDLVSARTPRSERAQRRLRRVV